MSLTIDPSSVNPEGVTSEIAVQITLPAASVVKALEPEQVAIVPIRSPPPLTCKPPARVEVADVVVMSKAPPVIWIPPAKVEVAVEEELRDWI